MASAATAPQGRGYEMVSPVDKLGAVPNFPQVNTDLGFAGFSGLTAASEAGDKLVWVSTGAFAGAKSSVPMSYMSSRTAQGWGTTPTSPDPVSEHPGVLFSTSIVRDATPDLSLRIIPSNEEHDPLIQGPFGGPLKLNVFVQTDSGLTWVSRPNSGPSTLLTDALYSGMSADGSHVLFGTQEALTPEAAGLSGEQLYDHTGGQTVMVNVDDGGNPVSACGAVVGMIRDTHAVSRRNILGAISDDGDQVVFTAPHPEGSGDPSCSDPFDIYVRRGGTTVQASASQRTVPDPFGPQPAIFEGAATGGGVNKVFFRSDEALTDDAQDGSLEESLLYEYDVSTDTLTLVTPNDAVKPGVRGVVGMSKDGARLYLVALGNLTPDAPVNAEPKLYMYANDAFTFIGELEVNDVETLIFGESTRQARLTPDGNRILFSTKSDLRSFTVGGHSAVYRYDAPSDTLSCLSCPSNGAGTPTQDAALFSDTVVAIRQTVPRNLTADGSRAFFEAKDGLVPQDDNGVRDVYMWEEGKGVSLMSGGHGREPSFFADSANAGNDVFFSTSDRLVPQDTNADPDFYDARVGGGFPFAEAPGLCVDGQCQGQPKAPPALAEPGSDEAFGNGNASGSGKVKLSVGSISPASRRAFARSGRLTLALNVGAAGTARVVAKARIGKKLVVVASARKASSRPGVLRVRLKLSGAAQRRLASSGRLKVAIAVTFPGASTRKVGLTLTQAEQGSR